MDGIDYLADAHPDWILLFSGCLDATLEVLAYRAREIQSMQEYCPAG